MTYAEHMALVKRRKEYYRKTHQLYEIWCIGSLISVVLANSYKLEDSAVRLLDVDGETVAIVENVEVIKEVPLDPSRLVTYNKKYKIEIMENPINIIEM